MAERDFAGNLLRAIRHESGVSTVSLFEQLSGLFSRLAMASAFAITLCVAADYCLSNFIQPDLSTSATEISEQWLFAVR